MKPMDKDTAEVIFQPSGLRGKVPKGPTIIEASRMPGAGIEALCEGRHVCGKCKVRIDTGRFREYGIESKPINAGCWQTVENEHITLRKGAVGYFPGFMAAARGDPLITAPEETRSGKKMVSKAAHPIPIDHSPAVKTDGLQPDPEPLVSGLFTASNHSDFNIKARYLGLYVNPSPNVHVLPNIAEFAGGDNAGIILVEEPQISDDTILIIDIGTNGELALMEELEQMLIDAFNIPNMTDEFPHRKRDKSGLTDRSPSARRQVG